MKQIKLFEELSGGKTRSDSGYREKDIDFAKWCLENKKYKYDSKYGWFDSKTLGKLSWDEIYSIYKSEQ